MMSVPQPKAAAIRRQPRPSAPIQMGMPTANQSSWQQEMLNVAVWRTDHGFVSTMHIKNSLTTGPITVVPVLYSEEGENTMFHRSHFPLWELQQL